MKNVDIRSFVFGGTASVCAEFGTFPLDTAKTRLMVQGQRAEGRVLARKYRGMLHAFYKISAEEGTSALFKGQATYGTIKIGIYESLKAPVSRFLPANTLGNNVLCAAVAGTVSSCLATPTDVLKVRLQASGLKEAAEPNHGSMVSAFADIYKRDGLSGLWRGVGPTAQRATLVCSVQLPAYEAAKRFCHGRGVASEDSVVCHLLSSIFAGTASAAACNPVDVVKNRMMNQCSRAAGSGYYTCSLDCLVKTCSSEGPRALWKGLVPNCMRLGPWNIIFFTSLEQMKQLSDRVGNIRSPAKLDSMVAMATAMESDL